MKPFELQPLLENKFVRIRPLQQDDFETLYQVASDPLIWEQHPNKDRYKKEVFEVFFKGAMESKGAFLVFDVQTQQVIGSTRYYGLDGASASVFIGYTFLAKDHWGSTFNPALKRLMIGYAFQFVRQVFFHIGEHNIRSQKAIGRLGAIQVGREKIAYYGEPEKWNVTYRITKEDWIKTEAYESI